MGQNAEHYQDLPAVEVPERIVEISGHIPPTMNRWIACLHAMKHTSRSLLKVSGRPPGRKRIFLNQMLLPGAVNLFGVSHLTSSLALKRDPQSTNSKHT